VRELVELRGMIVAANRPLFGGWATCVALQVPPPRFMPTQMALVQCTMMCVNHENRVDYSSLGERNTTQMDIEFLTSISIDI
jgi:hypothetical protein